jgi:hypothetical protein
VVNVYSPQSHFTTAAHGSLWRLLFAALLLVALPIFIWAVATQRIELRKKAATSEPPIVCWNRVTQDGSGGGGGIYWPNSCKGSPDTSLVCAQVKSGLTPTEQYQYGQWVNAGKPYIPGCMPDPAPIKTINWSTPHVSLVAEDLTIIANGKTFKGIPDQGTHVKVTSDPGNREYTTLEAIWREQGVEMRLFMYFYATNVVPSGFSGNGPYWGTSEIRTYNGNDPGDWIYYTNRTVMGRVGSPGPDAISFASTSGSGQLTIKDMKLQAFLNRTPYPCRPLPVCSYNPEPNQPRCTITATPDGGGEWCPRPTPPYPTCIPRPACMDPLPGQPQCQYAAPAGGILCPKTPTPTPVASTCTGEGTTCTIGACPTCPPGQPCPRIACKLQSGICQKGHCVAPPDGCRYVSVQCVQAPCPQSLVCGTPTPIITTTTRKIGDINRDGTVDIFDYNLLLTDFGKSRSAADITGDGKVDIFDYNLLLQYFNT